MSTLHWIYFFTIIFKRNAYGLKRLSVDFDVQSGVSMVFVHVVMSMVCMFVS